MKLLLVDDESHVLEGIRTMVDWNALGIERVATARNGEQAWDAYANERPDILMTDVSMPKMNGLELVRKIREQDPALPVIILSGYDDFAFAREAIHLNVSKYVLKPSTHDEIEAALLEVKEALLERRREQRLSEQFERQLREALPILRERFLFEWIAVGARPSEDLEDLLAFYRIEHPIDRGAIVASVKLYRPPAGPAISEREWQLFMFSFTKLVSEALPASGGCYALRFIDDRLPLVFFDADEASARCRAEGTMRDILEKARASFQLDVHASVGQWYADPSMYSRSYRESLVALTRNEDEGFHQLFRYEPSNEAADWPLYPIEHTKQLYEAFLRVDEPAVRRKWEELEACFSGERTTFAYAQTASLAVVTELMMRFMEWDAAFMDSSQWLQVMNRMQQCRTKEMLFDEAKGFAERVLALLRRRFSEQNSRSYTEAIKKHVAARYAEPLSFTELAKGMHLTRNYLSYVFKRDTGMNFIQYVTNYRIRKAEELLLSGDYRVYEVGEKVGYPDPAYFSRVFKSITGRSPADFGAKKASESRG
ncbi:response regulator transcription factor [Paenibacillus sp.]|uniref:response regulator transcription factor n=1 Tax=Paenibacillus sp. TaxID=58172 RepID=UPI002D3AA881|nr:response regulator [Paenibacillus sp.]HZG58424.1 response regulator [Paenibacillus sp.]